MKLSKQERIGAFIIAIVVILAVGIFVFIKPRIEAISTTTKNLDNKQQELVKALEKQKTKDGLKQDVLDAYEKGSTLADMFFEEMTVYEAEEEFRAFLSQCDAKVLVESLKVSAPETTTIAPQYFTEKQVSYALKTYVTKGLEKTEEQIAAEKRLKILKDKLGSSQTIGSIRINFTVSAIDQEELLVFCDEVNNYIKKENGKDTRKAMTIAGFSFNYPLVVAEYEEMIKDIQAKAQEAGTKELYKNYNQTPPTINTAPPAENLTPEKEAELKLTDNLISVSTSITFYSVERMQDPTDQLDAQDGIAF